MKLWKLFMIVAGALVVLVACLAISGVVPVSALTIPGVDPHTIPGIDPHTIPGVDPHMISL